MSLKFTGQPAKDAVGNEIKAETTKAADASGAGTWSLAFEFDATGLGGKKYVSFVEIYDGSTKLDEFDMKNKDDKMETFFIPEIKTKLTDADSGTNVTTGGASMLIDEITYSNLLPNTNYKIVSSLVDAGRYLTYGDIAPDNHDGNGIIFELNKNKKKECLLKSKPTEGGS